MNRLRAVLVGAGKVGAGYADDPVMARHYPYATHAQVLAAHSAFTWVGVADRREEAAQATARRWGVPASASSARALRAAAPEVAVLAVPPEERLAVLEELPDLRAVVVEKPLGHDARHARAFLDACSRRSLAVQVNYWRRGDALMRTLANGGLAARVGRPQAATVWYGNGLRNNGSHMVDLVRMLLGEVEAVCALGPQLPGEGLPLAGDTQGPFALRLRDGPVVAAHALDFRRYRENGLDVWGDAGRLTITQEGLGTTAYPVRANRGMADEREVASDLPEALKPTAGEALYHLYTNLADGVHHGATLWCGPGSAWRTEQALAAVAEAAAVPGAWQEVRS